MDGVSEDKSGEAGERKTEEMKRASGSEGNTREWWAREEKIERKGGREGERE